MQLSFDEILDGDRFKEMVELNNELQKLNKNLGEIDSI